MKAWLIRSTTMSNHYFYVLNFDGIGRCIGSTWGNKEFGTGLFKGESFDHANGWAHTLRLSKHECEVVHEEVPDGSTSR